MKYIQLLTVASVCLLCANARSLRGRTLTAALGYLELDVAAYGIAAPQAGSGFTYPSAKPKPPAFHINEAEGMLIEPESPSFDSHFKQTTLSTSTEYARALSTNAAVQAEGWGASVQTNLKLSKQSKGSSSKLVVQATNHVIATQPTVMQKCPKLTESAKQLLLEKGPLTFMNQYGTHFIYGYRASASATLQVTIDTKTVEQKEELAVDLQASYGNEGLDVNSSSDLGSAIDKHAKNMKKTLELITSGVTGSPEDKSLKSMGDFVFALSQHRSAISSRSKVILYPHSFCPEYQSIVSQVPELPTAQPDSALLKAWALIKYAGSSYDELQEAVPDPLADKMKSLGQQTRELRTRVGVLVRDSAKPQPKTNATQVSSAEQVAALRSEALALGNAIEEEWHVLQAGIKAAEVEKERLDAAKKYLQGLKRKWKNYNNKYREWHGKISLMLHKERNKYGMEQSKAVRDQLRGAVSDTTVEQLKRIQLKAESEKRKFGHWERKFGNARDRYGRCIWEYFVDQMKVAIDKAKGGHAFEAHKPNNCHGSAWEN